MTDIFKEKEIGHESILLFYGYTLSEQGAEALNRPVGSYELYLELRHNGRYITNTHPTSSHYFTKEQYAEIFDAIKTPMDFFRTKMALRCINSKESAEKLIAEKGLKGIASIEPKVGQIYTVELEDIINTIG